MISMRPLRELLREHPVFMAVEASTFDSLVEQALHRNLRKGDILAMQGQLWPYMFFVAEGEVDAVKVSIEGRNLLVTTFRSGELFWGLSLFQENAPLVATLEAHCSSHVVLWSRECIEPIFIENGRMSWELCRVMIQRMQRASAIVEELAFQPVAGRLAGLLLDHFQNAGEPTIERLLTLDEMAARVGTTREMVCRALYRFAAKGLINVTRTEFVLTDREGLSRLAAGS